jgi:hypothetical protein
MPGVVVGFCDVPGIPREVIITQGIFVSIDGLRSFGVGKNGQPCAQPIHPEGAKSTITVINNDVILECSIAGHISMLGRQAERAVV